VSAPQSSSAKPAKGHPQAQYRSASQCVVIREPACPAQPRWEATQCAAEKDSQCGVGRASARQYVFRAPRCRERYRAVQARAPEYTAYSLFLIQTTLCSCELQYDHGIMTLDEFRSSLTLEQPPLDLGHALAGLWWDAKGDWTRAHESAQQDEGPAGALVHAYL